MDERLRRYYRQYAADPSPENAMMFMQWKVRIDPPVLCGKTIKDTKPFMTNCYSRLVAAMEDLEMTEDSPLESIIALEPTDFTASYNFGYSSVYRLLKALVSFDLKIPDSWIRTFNNASSLKWTPNIVDIVTVEVNDERN